MLDTSCPETGFGVNHETIKSSLINYLFPHLDLNTQEVSDWSGKGLHTTTFAQMYDLPEGGSVIDTPGMRELGLVNLEYPIKWTDLN